jgi:hypothetical protein
MTQSRAPIFDEIDRLLDGREEAGWPPFRMVVRNVSDDGTGEGAPVGIGETAEIYGIDRWNDPPFVFLAFQDSSGRVRRRFAQHYECVEANYEVMT